MYLMILKALDTFEKQTQQKVVSSSNFIEQIKAAKEQKKLKNKKTD